MSVAEPRATTLEPLRLRDISRRLERALAYSTADQAELVWIESSLQHARSGFADDPAPSAPEPPAPEVSSRTVVARVVEGGRLGCHETGGGEVGEIADALRLAVVASRVAERSAPPLNFLDGETEPQPDGDLPLFDRETAGLDRAAARDLVGQWTRTGERAELSWSHHRVLIANSRGLRRRTECTCASLTVHCGDHAGSGSAHASARGLAMLDSAAVFARARARHAAAPAPDAVLPTVDLLGVGAATKVILLSAEATGELVWLLGRIGLSAAAFHQSPARSRLAEWLGKPLFSKQIQLIDDATASAALPFPFDLEGCAKRPIELIAEGVLRTPAVDARLAAELGLAATPHRLAAGEAWPSHLILTPGAASVDELLATVADGLSIDRLEGLEAYDPSRLRFRARARGLRRIQGGQLAEPLADALWEDSLDRIFRDVAALGAEPTVQARESGMGGVSAPALLLAPPGVRHA